MSIIKDRQESDIEAVRLAQTGEPVDEEPPVGMDGEAVPDIPTGGGFIGEAYEKIVVTASRVGQDPLDSPSTLTVLTSEDIRMMGAQNVGDVLRRVAGVGVMNMAADLEFLPLPANESTPFFHRLPLPGFGSSLNFLRDHILFAAGSSVGDYEKNDTGALASVEVYGVAPRG